MLACYLRLQFAALPIRIFFFPTHIQYSHIEPVTLQENVGQRTRSKLDFHNLPLECIEQAYVPPDITADMYETECDNPDWHDFLKEFTQPLSK
jgi:hypothetical protein